MNFQHRRPTGGNKIATGSPMYEAPRFTRYKKGAWRWDPSTEVRAKFGLSMVTLHGDDGRKLVNQFGADMWDAFKAGERMNAALDSKTPLEELTKVAGKKTFGALCDLYLKRDYVTGTLKGKTNTNYKNAIKVLRTARADFWETEEKKKRGEALDPPWNDMLIDNIDNGMCEKFFLGAQKKWRTQGHKLYTVFCMLYEYAITTRFATKGHPCRKLSGMITPEGRKNSWEADEPVAYIQAADWVGLPCHADWAVCAMTTCMSPIDLKEWQRAKLLPVLDQPDRGYYMGVRRNKLDTRTRRSNPLTPFIPATPLLQWRIALMNERNDKAGAPKTHQLIYSFGNIPVFEMKSNDFTRQQAGLRKLAGGDIAGFLKCKAIPSKIRARVSLDTELPFTPAPSLLKPNARGLFKEMRDLRATGLNRYKNKTPANSMVAALIAAQALGTTMIEGKMQADPTVLGDHYLSRDEESGRMVARSAAMNAFDDIAPRLMNSNIKPLG